MPSPKYLDMLAEVAIREYFDIVMNEDEPERLLSEEDALGGALKAFSVYQCKLEEKEALDRSMDMAFQIQEQLRRQATR